MPYLRAKAQDHYEELGGGIDSELLDGGMDARQIRLLTDQACSIFESLWHVLIGRIELQRQAAARLQACVSLVKPVV